MLLIVHQNRRKAVPISDSFYFMNILSYPCTPKEALQEISTKYHGVLIVDPEELPDVADFITRLRSMSLAPIFAFSANPKKCPNADMFDLVCRQAILSSNLAIEMIKYCYENDMRPIGDYALAGIDCSPFLKIPTYYFGDIHLTKTERMVLCYFTVTYPIKQTKENIVEYAFKARKKPDPTSVRTHISNINKKIRNYSGHNIIGNIPGEGYYLLTPEIARKLIEIL